MMPTRGTKSKHLSGTTLLRAGYAPINPDIV